MTNNSNNRLDRLEALDEKILEDLKETREGLQETRARPKGSALQIANSNARAIQAMMKQQASDRLRHEESIGKMNQTLAKALEIQDGLARILISIG